MSWETLYMLMRQHQDILLRSFITVVACSLFYWVYSTKWPKDLETAAEPQTPTPPEVKTKEPEPKKVYKIEMPELAKAPEKVIPPHRSYTDNAFDSNRKEAEDERLERWRDEAAERRLRKRRERDRQYWGY